MNSSKESSVLCVGFCGAAGVSKFFLFSKDGCTFKLCSTCHEENGHLKRPVEEKYFSKDRSTEQSAQNIILKESQQVLNLQEYEQEKKVLDLIKNIN